MANLTEFKLSEAVEFLSRTPAALSALLRGLPEFWVRANEGKDAEGKDSWSPYDIVGHLVYAERADWVPRVRTILEHGEARAFEPFDRFAQLKEDKSRPLGQLLDDFARLRKDNLAAVQALNLSGTDLAKRGKHPSLGVVKLSELLATWAAHDLTHLHQLSRVMAYQYRDAVGPWTAYLGVLKCAGHSAAS
jgi:hypothetical protein